MLPNSGPTTPRRVPRRVQCLLLTLLLAGRTGAEVVINEIHYNGEPNNAANEFIELANTGSTAVDLSGWAFTDGIQFAFPPGTLLPAGGFLVVAERPSALLSEFGVTALGPYTGELSGDGERVQLRDSGGVVRDEVTYQPNFPWPVGAGGTGASMELIQPTLDNDLGGSWRSSRPVNGPPVEEVVYVAAADSNWRYREGRSEASSPPDAWRQVGFVEDGTWLTGRTPIGYGDNDDNTELTMQNLFSTVYLRRVFNVNAAQMPNRLMLRVYADDGAVVWINGIEAARVSAPAGELPFDALGINHEATWDEIVIANPSAFLVDGPNLLAVHALNTTLDSSDFSIDVELRTPAPDPQAGGVPTPGRTNSVFAVNAPPQIRQVDHAPQQPQAGAPTVITAKVTDPDGVALVELEYQIVAPGAYVSAFLAKPTSQLLASPNSPNDPNPAYAQGWIRVAMTDNGAGADAAAGDDIYTVELPGRPNRTLVRYRITVADALGRQVRVPYADDEALNFAYFVYDGVPDYVAETRSVLGAPQTYPKEIMTSVPVYHLIANPTDFAQARGYNGGDQIPRDNYDARSAYNWSGTFVYEGVVYDNIGYRLRQRNARYSGSGKRSWKFRFNRGALPVFRDMAGNRYERPWESLSSHKMVGSRGNPTWGLLQTANHILWNMTGTPASLTHWFHLRVVQGAEEAPAGVNGQHLGDFYGLLLAMEEFDVRFLENHDLPKGNLYKLISGRTDGVSVRRYLAQDAVDDGTDFQNIIFNLRPTQSDAWLLQHVNYDQWYRYHAIVDAVRHYDVQPNTAEHLKNRAYYFEPSAETPLGRLQVFPWDSDTSWGPNWNAGEDFCKQAIYGVGGASPRPAFVRDYKNVVREIRDLIWTEEQINLLLDPLVARIAPFVPADRDRWTGSPASAGSQSDPPIETVVNDMKRFAFIGGSWTGGSDSIMEPISRDTGISGQQGRDAYLDALGDDPGIPGTPVIQSTGPSDFPVNRLMFQALNYSGASPFAAWKWRIAEVTSTNDPPLPAGQRPKFEAEATWTSDDIPNENEREIQIPSSAVRVDRTYRVRARAKDIGGRWSHWSAPVEFRTREPDSAVQLLAGLRVTELMFNAPGGSEFDFVELHNTSLTVTQDLGGARFTQGIDFTFPRGTLLEPGAYLVVVPTTNHPAFRAAYNLGPSTALIGPYAGNFSNGGEDVVLRTSAGGTDIVAFGYRDGRGWPLPADGSGHSLIPLVIANQADGSLNYGGNWRASARLLGSPGGPDPEPSEAIRLHEIAAHTDFPLPPPEDSNDWIELWNSGPADFTFGPGWYLSDNGGPTNLTKWMIPPGTVIPAGGYLAFDERTGFHNPVTTGFGLDKAGEAVFLSYLPGTAEDRVVDSVAFKGQENGWTLGRVADGNRHWHALTPGTRSSANTAPGLHVSISEIMYHPPDLPGFQDNNEDEFIELFNPTTQPVQLFSTNGAWRLDGAVEFTFPNNTVLPPMGYLAVVSFDPSDTARAQAFRSRYGLSDASLPLVGPYSGELNNSSERLGLERPQAPDFPDVDVSWVIVDEVIYADRAPWPQGADGIGASLQRLDYLAHGNEPSNWRAANPSLGNAYLGGTPPVITLQPSPASQIVGAGSSVTYQAAASGFAPVRYQWMLNNRAIREATNAVLTLGFVSPPDSGEYRVVAINGAGSALSQAARLLVTTPPRILAHPGRFTVLPGESVTFSVAATGAGILTYAWFHNDVLVPGATESSLVLGDIQESDGGQYVAMISDTNGIVLSDPGQLRVLVRPVVVVPPLSQSVVAGGTVTFSIVTTGTLPIGYRWRRASTTVLNEVVESHTHFLTLTNVQLADAGLYTVVLTNEAFFTPGVLSPSARLTVLTDTDGDGMPDTWETEHGLNPNNPSDAFQDLDGDAMSNRDEYESGTIPSDPGSYLRVETIAFDPLMPGRVRLTFPAMSNRTYSVLFRDALGLGPWEKLEDVTAGSSNRTVEVLDNPALQTGTRYYQLVTPRQ